MRRVRATLQRKMLGHVLARIERAQALLGEMIAAGGTDALKAAHQRRLFTMNQLLWPWLQALCKLSMRRELKRIGEWWKRQGVPHMERVLKGHVVYARFNMRTQHLYVGETEDYQQRVQRHAYATFRHGTGCTKACRGCSEHLKYRRHRVAATHEWVVVPITPVNDRAEARQMEDLLKLKWSPQLNIGDKPYYLMKDTYARDIKEVKRRDKRSHAPWQGGGVRKTSLTRQAVTLYESERLAGAEVTRKAYKLERLLEAGDGTGIKVCIRPGYVDLTDWRKLRLVWGSSYVKVIRPDGSRRTTTLEQWRPREERHDVDFTVYIVPRKAAVVDRESVVEDITKEQERMKEYDDEHIAFLWRARNTLTCEKPYKWRQVLWTELQRRYDGLPRKPIEVSIPYLERIDIVKVKGMVTTMIEAQEWPQFLKEWHRRSFRVTTKGAPTIADILTNVTKPSWIQRTCKCRELKQRCPQDVIIDGHVLMIGRDFRADEDAAMRVCAGNIPRPTWGDVFRAWDEIGKQLPAGWCDSDKEAWKQRLFTCTKPPYAEDRRSASAHRGVSHSQLSQEYKDLEEEVPTTKQVYEIRKRLKGMVIGPLDKNNGELWAACPVLYHKALRKAYSEEAGYQRVWPARMSQYRKKRYNDDELSGQILRDAPLPDKQKGSEVDIMKLFARIYKKRGWDEYAKFDSSKGGLNQPYILFKAKNMIDRKVRRLKWTKVRPIAPGTRHPAKKLMHYIGRAWSFVTSQIPGEHFVINKTSEVPNFLREAEREVGRHGELQMKVYDIESCYPNMPRETIRFALRSILKRLETEKKYDGVYVPKYSDAQPCTWHGRRKNSRKIPFQVMLDVMEFSLDFTLIRMPNGAILRQAHGIPMGDPLSPGMTIGTCAWMEQEWLQTVAMADRKYFRMKRFMDDILMVYAKTRAWDSEQFVADFAESHCYQEPLKLEPGNDGVFLETRYWIEGGHIKHRLKNDNEGGGKKVWRYQHWYSNSSFLQKRATLTACLRKVHQMASGPEQVFRGALEKIAEFRRLHYPLSVLQKACNYLGATSGEGTWITVRNALR